MHSDEDGHTYVLDHECERIGKDAGYVFRDDDNFEFVFRDNPVGQGEFPSTKVWSFFEMPEVKTVAELRPKKYERNLAMCKHLEEINKSDAFPGFYPGQADFISRIACVDEAAVCGDVGTGKTLMAITLKALKNASHCLLIAPKGTVKDAQGNAQTFDPAQWVEEVNKFSPDTAVFQLFCREDYLSLLNSNGKLPPGLYITYPSAFFTNGAFEKIPKAWAASKREEKFRARLTDGGFDAPYDKESPPARENQFHHGVGQTRNGFTCIVKPSLSTLCKHQFKMTLLDEAHVMQNLDSQVTSAILRIQTKYKYALTATLIPNILHNAFPILGWLGVPNWYHGEKSNPRWPFPIEGERDFRNTFMTAERDYTEEAIRGNGSTCIKQSPVISQAQRLLKTFKSLVAYISKEECNPDVVDCNVETLRVPMGYQQKLLYSHNLQIKNIPFTDPKTKYGVQLTRLRGICAEPLSRTFNNGIVASNFNPKLLTTLTMIGDCLEKNEQVVVISAFCGQSTEIGLRLDQAGIAYSRIDSERSNHAREANKFKKKETPVLLMGAKCAQAHSFPNCSNLIIGSIEWSYGAFHQALGRVYRLNSPKDVNIKVILNKDSIEESMFDKLADKRDAATICLEGQYVPSDYKSGDINEVMADHFLSFDSERIDTESELETELKWSNLRAKLAVQAGVKLSESECA
jgi:hypothetical protein